MKSILIVMGTRPEAIKMAPVIEAFKQCPEIFNVEVCVTAQHRELLDSILNEFGITPDFDLDIMQKAQSLFDITAEVLLEMERILNRVQPDLVMVQGDTTTTFASALAAFYKRTDVGHIEAGLRTNNMYSPYPEEVNRQLTTKLARYHFAPTELNKQNLLKENISAKNIAVTGNTVIDALFVVLSKINRDKSMEENMIRMILRSGFLPFGNTPRRRYVLVTGHRRESFGQGFLNICKAIKKIATRHPEIDIVYPVHPNPNVRVPVIEILTDVSNIYLIEPLNYASFVYLMAQSFFLLTDSGGVQEEAPSLGKPVLVMRNTTERPEAVQAGTVKILGTDPEAITRSAETLLVNKTVYRKMAEARNPYGDGKASHRIVNFVKARI